MTDSQDRRRRSFTRRDVLKGTSAAALALALGPTLRTEARQTPTTRNIKGTELSILQWNHFVPRHDKWFDQFAQDWGKANEVAVKVDHVNTADVRPAFVSEISAGQGHDLVQDITPNPDFEPSLLDLTDVVNEVSARHGEWSTVSPLVRE